MMNSTMFLYIDPGTGSMLFSIFIGLTTTVVFGIRALSIKLKSIMGRGKQTELDKSHQSIVIYSDSKRQIEFVKFSNKLTIRDYAIDAWTDYLEKEKTLFIEESAS